MTLLQNLNEPQKQAVMANEGPFLVIAGAGSGKTTALTRRVSFLIRERNVAPFNILAVTFTNKAAGEMKERVAEYLGGEYAMPLIGTFHSICVRILREEIHGLGYSKDFTILDQQDQLVVVKKVLKEMELPSEQFAPKIVAGSISRAKNNLLSPKDLFNQMGSYYEEQVSQVYDRYQKYLRENNSLDFDDLIRLTILLFEKNAEILEKYRKRFQYILVDEYQDTNYAQYKLIKLLAQKHQNIFVVGDDWQSIYRWRGADVSNILNFEKDYPNAKIIKLEQNYRSTQKILDAAHHVIKDNVSRSEKKIWTDKTDGKNLVLFQARSEQEEAGFIAQNIKKLVEERNYSLNDFVVLYRTNAQSRAVEECLLKENISYRIVGGIKFYARKEVKNVIAYLRLINNLQDIVSLERALSEPKRGIGGKTLEKWTNIAKENKMNLINLGLSEKLNEVTKSKVRQKNIIDFCKLIKNFNSKVQKINETENLENIKIDGNLFTPDLEKVAKVEKTEKNAEIKLMDLIKQVYEKSGYKKFLLDGSIEGETRDENVQELLSVAGKYDGIENALQIFLEEVALVSDTDKINQDVEMVHLMTLHSAKGLEFPVVFIIGLEEGLMPHSRSLNNNEEMEEERRLMYVGITRAKELVYLVSARQRILFGSLKSGSPSRFLGDIPNELLEDFGGKSDFKNNSLSSSFSSASNNSNFSFKNGDDSNNFSKNSIVKNDNPKEFRDGAKVSHDKFGKGVVVSQDNKVISVVFKDFGLKRLAKGFAGLK
ncbi:MAG: UvrD-helicase domain-containing protein [Candidatus Moranbacteria bacterium]|nr:UvrD-helicase domain-containing protein [Candidatus Moranbacteria bacterium]